MTSIVRVMEADVSIPDFSCITKRSIDLPVILMSKAMEPGSIVIVDSTGLKVYGKDEWHQENIACQHGALGGNCISLSMKKHQLLACELTTPEVGDPAAVPDLLAQITMPFDTFIGDGAYDGDPISQAVLSHQPDAQVVIPPHKTAVYSVTGDTQRDQHLEVIAKQGRVEWQRKTGYNLRNYVELAMQRFKRIFGNTMKARKLPQQKTEARISASALNRMTNLGIPVSVKI